MPSTNSYQNPTMPFNIPFVNNFDIFSYFIPGAFLILILILPFMISGQFETEWISDNTTISLLLFLFLGYLIGHWIQFIRKSLGLELIFHTRILTKENPAYAEKARKSLASIFLENEKALEKGKKESKEVEKKRLDILNKSFLLAYRTVVAQKLNPHTDLFNGLYHMHLGIWIASLISIAVFVLKEVIGFFIISFNIPDIIFIVVALLISYRTVKLSWNHLKKNSDKVPENTEISDKEPSESRILKWFLGIITIIFISLSYHINPDSIQSTSILSAALILFSNFILLFSSERATYFAKIWAYGVIDAFYSNYVIEEVRNKKSGRKK